VAPDITGVVNELSSAENGAVVFASSTGRQYSFEDPNWGMELLRRPWSKELMARPIIRAKEESPSICWIFMSRKGLRS